MRRILVMCTALTLWTGCGQEEAPPAPAPRAAAPAETSAVPIPEALQPTRGTTFARDVPELRKSVRDASLRAGTTVPEEIPFYRIDAAIDADFMTYEGSLDLWVRNNGATPWSYLVFHLYPNIEPIAGSLRHLKVTGAMVADQEVVGRDLVNRYELPLGEPLLPGDDVAVSLSFKGVLKRANVHDSDPASDLWKILLGMMESKAGDWGVYAYSSRTASLSLWYPVLAAYDQSGWDVVPADDIGDFSYFDVADVLLNLQLDRAWRVEASGTVENHGDGMRTIRAGAVRELTVVASPILVPEQRKAGIDGNIVVRSYARPGHERTRRLVLECAADALLVFERAFGPYPYTELDVIEADLFGGAGGVEFPGLTTIASFLYMDGWKDLAGDGADLLDSRFLHESIQFVVAHEVAHQWWNAVVGSHSRNHPFLDEALAMYSAILYFQEIQGEAAANRQRIFELELPYQIHRYIGGKDLPVDQSTSAFSDLVGYSAIVYAKGGLYLLAQEELLGQKAFLAGLARYYRGHRFAIASPGDLQRALEEGLATGLQEQVASTARRWLQETHGDKDIGAFDPAIIVPLLLAELDMELDGFFLSMLKEEGFWEAVKLAVNFIEGKDDPFTNVRMDKVLEWGSAAAKKLMWDILL